LCIFFLASPAGVFAQAGSAKHAFFNPQITVQVRTQDNSPAPEGTLVELDAEDGAPIDRVQTDASGKCRFIPPAPAVYYVRAKQAGYQEASYRVDLQNVMTGMAVLVLKPIPGQTPPPIPGVAISVNDLGVPESARKEFEKGKKALGDNDLNGGTDHLKKAIKEYPAFSLAYVLLGTAYNQQKKWNDARGALEKAIQLDPKSGEAYIQLGAALRQQKDLAGAEKALTKGLELSPDAPSAGAAEYELAKAYMDMGQWQKAEPYATKAVASEPNFAPARLLLGNICLKKGDGAGALKEFQEYLRIDPNGSAAPQIKEIIPKIQAAMERQKTH
jgi:Tfp pilus assembly protein PilF